MAPLAKRVATIPESETLRLNALVQKLKKEGRDVINLTAGEPDFNVPDAAKTAVIEAVTANRSKYTPVAGIAELRELVAAKTNAQQPGLTSRWSASHVVVSNGAKQALYNACLALIDPGDEVIIISPYWLTYPEIVKLCGGVPKVVKTRFEDQFKISPEALKKQITARTKAVILNSPSNPTGVVYSKDELSQFADVLQSPSAQGVLVLSDEIYDRHAYEPARFTSLLEAAPSLQDRVVTVNGMSKSAAMTGWRIGWSVAPHGITDAIAKLQGQTTSGINALAQAAGVAGLRMQVSEFRHQIEAFRRRRDIVLEILGQSEKIKIVPPDGAFYVLAGVSACFGLGEEAAGFAERMLEQAGVAVVAGTPFGEPDFVRLSFAVDDATLEEGCRRFVSFVEKSS